MTRKRLPPGTPILTRVMSNISRSENGCWEWKGHIDAWGYGRIKLNGRCALAHRVSYEAHGLTIPDGMILRHRCDNAKCVCPDHLTPGTDMDNMRDAIERGRFIAHDSILAVRIAMARRYGLSFREAGEPFGMDRSTAFKQYRRALRMLEELRPEIFARLEVVG